MRRIATVAAAGILASELGMLPFSREGVLTCAAYVSRQWLGDSANLPPTTKGLIALREFLLSNEARMRPAGDDSRSVRDLVGYTNQTDRHGRLFLMTTSGLAEACRGYDVRSIVRELKNRDLIFLQEVGKMTSKHTIKGGGRQSLYAIREGILDFEG